MHLSLNFLADFRLRQQSYDHLRCEHRVSSSFVFTADLIDRVGDDRAQIMFSFFSRQNDLWVQLLDLRNE